MRAASRKGAPSLRPPRKNFSGAWPTRRSSTPRALVDLILWRHAEAEPGEPDLGRRLTAKGLKQARRMAEWLHSRLPDSARILDRPATRAQQTGRAPAGLSRGKL